MKLFGKKDELMIKKFYILLIMEPTVHWRWYLDLNMLK